MLTAVVSSFYSQHMRAGSVDPRQLRMAMPFVKSSSRQLCAFSLPVSQVCRKVYINSLETVSLLFLKPLLKTSFCYNASKGHDENQAPILWDCPGLQAAAWGVHGMGPWHPPSSCRMGHTSQQTLHLRREGRLASLDGKVGASVKEVLHSIP